MGIKRQITRAAKLESLPDFRSFIQTICLELASIDGHTCYDLQLAVDEACTNIIEHGYAGMNPGSIILAVEADHGQMVITITDFGRSFKPNEVPDPDTKTGLENRPFGGFGLYFIYQTMDKVSYETTKDGNCLELVKTFQNNEESIKREK